MARDNYRPTLVLPSEAEHLIQAEAARRRMKPQEMMRSAVLGLLSIPAKRKEYRPDQIEVIDFLARIENTAPATANSLRRLIEQIARDFDEYTEAGSGDAVELSRQARERASEVVAGIGESQAGARGSAESGGGSTERHSPPRIVRK